MHKKLDHKTDLEVKFESDSLETLFSEAGRFIFSELTNPESVSGKEKRKFELREKNPELLFFSYLSELIYLFDTEKIYFRKFDVRIEGNSLSCTLYGGKAKKPPKTEIKAVTFHEFYLKKEDEKWKAHVIFDI